MADILKKPWLSRYNKANHIAFHEAALAICKKSVVIIDEQQMIDDYNTAIEQEKTRYNWLRRSDYTKKKKETDHERDITFNGMKMIVRSYLKDFDSETIDDARHVYNLLKNYGNIATMSYDAATVTLDSIIELLGSSDYTQAVLSLGILKWVNRLNELNLLFKKLVDDSTNESLKKPKFTNKTARHALDIALWTIVARIESLANINGQQTYLVFAHEFNLLVKHYNTLEREHYGRIHADTDISQSIVET
jgi:hypothetical protein